MEVPFTRREAHARASPRLAAFCISFGLHATAAGVLLALRPPPRPPVQLYFVDLVPAPGGGTAEAIGPRVDQPPAAATATVAPPSTRAVPAPRRMAAAKPRPAPDRPAEQASGNGAVASIGSAATTGEGDHAGVPGGVGTAPIRAEAAAVRPMLVARVLPDYPPAARRREIEGLVLLQVVVDRTGRVEEGSVNVIRSVPALDAAAVAAVKQWQFRPGRDSSGATVRVVVEVPIRFALR